MGVFLPLPKRTTGSRVVTTRIPIVTTGAFVVTTEVDTTTK